MLAHCRVELARTLALVEVAAADHWSRMQQSRHAAQERRIEPALVDALRALASTSGVGFISFVRCLEWIA